MPGRSPRVVLSDLAAIQPLRALHLDEIGAQVRYDACHARGWCDEYVLACGEVIAGYGSVKGLDDLAARDAVFEFYVLPSLRAEARALFGELLAASGARFIESQSNDALLSSLLREFSREVRSDVLLFALGADTRCVVPGAAFRLRRGDERVFDHQVEPVGEYVVELAGDVVATGGFALHYNPPFADLYMEVAAPHRRKGIGSFLVQELKRACSLAGRVPAARCAAENVASRNTLVRGGMQVCGAMLTGTIDAAASRRRGASNGER